MTRAEELVNDLTLNAEGSDSDGRVNRLLEEYYRGAPLDSLRTLIRSRDERLQGEAAWIGSELPNAGRGLLDDIRSCSVVPRERLDSSLSTVFSYGRCPRSMAVRFPRQSRYLVTRTGRSGGRLFAFLATADREQLQTAEEFLTAGQPSSPFLPFLRWMLSQQLSATQAAERILSDDPYGRDSRSWRPQGSRIEGLLKMAAESPDDEIAQFARDMLERMSVA